MKIAILGTRGIPASYSGFETAVEQLASRLSARGHEVVVYCRPHVVDRKLTRYKGAELVHLRTIQNKYLDTFVHTFRSAIHAARVTRPDAALFFIAGNSPLCLITSRRNIPAVINMAVGVVTTSILLLIVQKPWPSHSMLREAPWWTWLAGGILGTADDGSR